jgi:hypothetical protein
MAAAASSRLAQQINDRLIASPELDEVVTLFGGTMPPPAPVGAPLIRPNSPPGRLLWSALGLQSKSIDIEGGDIRMDLNNGRLPSRYRGAFVPGGAAVQSISRPQYKKGHHAAPLPRRPPANVASSESCQRYMPKSLRSSARAAGR